MNLDAILNYTGEGPASLDHAANMALTPAEVELAQTIKEAVEAELQLQNLSDFDYVQHALSSKGAPLPHILAKVSTLQSFKKEYRLNGSCLEPQEAMELLDQFTRDHPGFLLAMDYQPYDGNFLIVQDVAKFLPSSIKTLPQMRVFMAGFYYRFQAANSTFRAIRTGVTTIFESEGCSFEKNFDGQLIEKICYEIHQPYPTLLKDVHFLNAPTVISVICALLKASLPQQMMEAIHLGHQGYLPGEFEAGRRLDELFLTPTPEVARRAMLQKIEGFLTVRAQHERDFILPAR